MISLYTAIIVFLAMTIGVTIKLLMPPTKTTTVVEKICEEVIKEESGINIDLESDK